MGTITVEIYRMLGASMKGGVKEMPVSHGAIPEKALKGRGLDLGTRYANSMTEGDNSTKLIPSSRLGDAKPRRGSEIWEGTKVDCHPLARFVFHYRSKSRSQADPIRWNLLMIQVHCNLLESFLENPSQSRSKTKTRTPLRLTRQKSCYANRRYVHP